MIPHPPTLDTAHGTAAWEPVCRVTFIDPFGIIRGTQQVVSGVYTADLESWPRHEATFTLPTNLTAAGTTTPVSPYGGRVQISIGAKVGGVEQVFQLADLDVVETEIARPEGTITVRAVSHESRVNEDRYTTRSFTPAGLSSIVVRDLVRRTLGAGHPMLSTLSVDPTLASGAYPLDGDVWPTIEAIMAAAGGEALFSPSGQLVLRDEPVKSAPVFTFRTGEDPNVQGTLVGYRSTRGWAFNRVAVIYLEATGTLPSRITGLWEDTTSTSAVASPYGPHTRADRVTVDAGKLPTLAAANAAAAAIAKRAQGRYRSVTIRTLPAPWIEPGDTVKVLQLGSLAEDLLVTRMELPLTQLDAMTLECRDPAYTAT